MHIVALLYLISVDFTFEVISCLRINIKRHCHKIFKKRPFFIKFPLVKTSNLKTAPRRCQETFVRVGWSPK
jgi:hypothetical protein